MTLPGTWMALPVVVFVIIMVKYVTSELELGIPVCSTIIRGDTFTLYQWSVCLSSFSKYEQCKFCNSIWTIYFIINIFAWGLPLADISSRLYGGSLTWGVHPATEQLRLLQKILYSLQFFQYKMVRRKISKPKGPEVAIHLHHVQHWMSPINLLQIREKNRGNIQQNAIRAARAA